MSMYLFLITKVNVLMKYIPMAVSHERGPARGGLFGRSVWTLQAPHISPCDPIHSHTKNVTNLSLINFKTIWDLTNSRIKHCFWDRKNVTEKK